MREALLKYTALGLASAMLLAIPTAVSAAPTKKDILVASRALNFITTKPSGTVTASIVFDPASAESKADAESLSAIIGSSLKVGKVTLSAKMVPVGSLGDMAGSAIAFVAAGTSGHHDAISSTASGSGVLLASMDLACVQSQKCALGVSTSPKVEIYVSKSAASSAGVEFLPAFLMMVKEV